MVGRGLDLMLGLFIDGEFTHKVQDQVDVLLGGGADMELAHGITGKSSSSA
jgi:hypothetical protein